jgi:hypothetical protein
VMVASPVHGYHMGHIKYLKHYYCYFVLSLDITFVFFFFVLVGLNCRN